MSFVQKRIRPKNRWKSLISPIKPMSHSLRCFVCFLNCLSALYSTFMTWIIRFTHCCGARHNNWDQMDLFPKNQGTSTSLSLINPKTFFFNYNLILFPFKNHIHLFSKDDTLKVFKTIDCVSHDQRFIFFFTEVDSLSWSFLSARGPKMWARQHPHRASMGFFFQIAASVTSRQHKYRWDRVQIMFLTCAVPIEA